MVRVLTIAAVALTTLVAPSVGFAQGSSVEIDVDRHVTTVGEPIQVTVEIRLSGQSSYTEFREPKGDGLEIAGPTMQSRRFNIINGTVSLRETLVYQVTPTKAGKIKLGPAMVRLQAKKRMTRSNHITLTVKAAPNVPNLHGGTGGSKPSGPADQNGTLPGIFIDASVEPAKAYVGQLLVAKWVLYAQEHILGKAISKPATTDGFWVEDLDQRGIRRQTTREVVQGRVYYASPLLHKALFPQRAGKLKIGPLELTMRTERNPFGRTKRLSKAIEVEVMPLPEKGKPAGFNEANVGSFTLTSSLSQTKVRTGDAVKFEVVVSGTGNIAQLALPKVTSVDGLKVYDPKVKTKFYGKNNITGERILEFLVIPQRPGQLMLPVIEFPYFDPAAGQYKVAKTAALSLTAVGKAVKKSADPGSSSRNVLLRDIRPPRPFSALVHHERRKRGSPNLSWSMVILPFLLLGTILIGERVRARVSKPSERSVGRKVAARVREHLSKAANMRDDSAGFLAELSAALSQQLQHSLGQPTEGMTRDELREALRAAGLAEQVIQEISQELDNADFGRFSPAASTPQELDEALRRVSRLVSQVSQLKAKRGKKS